VRGHVDQFQEFVDARLGLGVVHLGEAESDVLAHREMREQREVLKDDPHIAGFGGSDAAVSCHQLVVEFDFTLGGCFEPGDHPEGRRLAAARGAEHRQQLAALDSQRDLPNCGLAAEGLGDAVEPQDRLVDGRFGVAGLRPAA